MVTYHIIQMLDVWDVCYFCFLGLEGVEKNWQVDLGISKIQYCIWIESSSLDISEMPERQPPYLISLHNAPGFSTFLNGLKSMSSRNQNSHKEKRDVHIHWTKRTTCLEEYDMNQINPLYLSWAGVLFTSLSFLDATVTCNLLSAQ